MRTSVACLLALTVPPLASAQKIPAPVGGPQTIVIPGVEAGENLGSSVHDAGDTNQDGVPDLIAGAPFSDANGTNSGAARVFSAADGALLHSFAGAGILDLYGRSVGLAGDVDQDGADDVIVGAFFADPTGPFAGEARVYSGLTGAELYQFVGANQSDQYGQSVSGAGDVDNDGFVDVVIGAWAADQGGLDAGLVEVRSGSSGALIWAFPGDSAADFLGTSVSDAGDVDNDGFDDVVAGAYADDNNGPESGMARVYSGQTGLPLFSFDGAGAGDELGESVTGLGDVDGDGFSDVAAGARNADSNGVDAGAVHVMSGRTATLIHVLTGETADDAFGSSVSEIGDVNLDGLADLIVGAPTHDGGAVDSGCAYVIDGGSGAVLARYEGAAFDDRYGSAVGSVGDLDGDGVREPLVGAFKSDLGGGDSGHVEVIIDCVGGVAPYGEGCPGSGGFVPSLAMSGCTRPQSLVSGGIAGGLGGSVAVLMIGAFPSSSPLGAGCSLLIAPVVVALPLPLGGAGPGQGTFAFAAVLPANLASASFTMQAYVVDPGAALGAAFTNGIKVTVP